MTVDQIKEVAKISFASKLFQMPNVESMATLMLLCQSEGIHPLQALKRYHIIKGRPSMRADAMLAEFQRAGGKIKWVIRTEEECKAIFSHEQGGELSVSWTIEMAKKAQLLGNPTWSKYPRQMLSARVISEGVRTIYPAIVTGLYTPEEVEDFDTKPIKQAEKKQSPQNLPPKQTNKPKTEEKITDAEFVTEAPAIEKSLAATDAESVFGGKAQLTGKAVADQKKQIRELCIEVGCKTPADMKAKTIEILGSCSTTMDQEQRELMIKKLNEEVLSNG